MPTNAWLLTCTTYGSWLPGDARWSYTVVSGTTTLTAPQPRLARYARNIQKHTAAKLTREQAELVLGQFLETSRHRGWTLHAAAVMYDHFHVVIASSETTKPEKMLADLKAYVSRVLTQHDGKSTGRRWWTNKGSKRLLPNEEALQAAIHYVLHKQPNPLAQHSP